MLSLLLLLVKRFPKLSNILIGGCGWDTFGEGGGTDERRCVYDEREGKDESCPRRFTPQGPGGLILALPVSAEKKNLSAKKPVCGSNAHSATCASQNVRKHFLFT